MEFAPGESEMCRNITILSDADVLDGTRTFEIMLNTSDSNIMIEASDRAQVSIMDTDCEYVVMEVKIQHG